MNTCNCDYTLKNTGTPDCQALEDVAYKLFLVKLRDNNGALNRVNLSSAALDSAYFTALINDSDESQRWFPIGALENVEDTRADFEFETANSGNKYQVRQGVGSFMAMLFMSGARYLKKIEGWNCVDFGIFVVDKSGNLIGDGSVSGYLAPIPVSKDSWTPKLVKATDTTVPKIQVMFDWKQTFKDSNLGMILKADMDDVDLTDITYSGLIDLFGGTPSSITTTGFTIKITTDFGSIKNNTPVEGLLLADFSLNNATTSSAVTISTLVESATLPGVYTFTFTAQTSADVLNLSVTADGFDDAALSIVDITIP